ncbi:hypothetical protein JOD27_008148 [Lentzea nigeriaca]|nr:hypothetical protein [Lentzea nigeriaca]
MRIVEAADLMAVVGSVGAGEFGEDALRRNLEDLAWLEATARAHDAVVDIVNHFGPTVPLRLATVYHDDDSVRASLVAHRGEFDTALRRVTGRTEWGVKGYADPDSIANHSVEEQVGDVGEGTAYLLRRRARLSALQAAESEAAAKAHRIHEALSRIAVVAKRQPVPHAELLHKRAKIVLNGTYLVDNERADEFADTVRTLDDQHPGIELDLTGPWPPYSFAGVDQMSP